MGVMWSVWKYVLVVVVMNVAAVLTRAVDTETNGNRLILGVAEVSGRRSYGERPAAIPGTIQAENYDIGGQSISYNDTSRQNLGGKLRDEGVDIQVTGDAGGGFNVGWIRDGEWLEYTVEVTRSGQYTLVARVSAKSQTAGRIGVRVDGAKVVEQLKLPRTGEWQKFVDVGSGVFPLTVGRHVIRLEFLSGEFNLNYFTITAIQEERPKTGMPGGATHAGMSGEEDDGDEEDEVVVGSVGNTGGMNSITGVRGDACGDGAVGREDLGCVVTKWLRSVSDHADQYRDGKVNAMDFGIVVASLGDGAQPFKPSATRMPTAGVTQPSRGVIFPSRVANTATPRPTLTPTPRPSMGVSPTMQVLATPTRPVLTPIPRLIGSGVAGSRGYWITAGELEQMRQKIESGVEPYSSRARQLYAEADQAWPGSAAVGGGVYTISGSFDPHFNRGGYTVYAKAIAFRLRRSNADADYVRAKVLDLTDITGFSGAETPIMLGWNLPAWVQAADLLEGYTGWTSDDKRKFQRWLTDVPYKACSSLGRIEDNNRGATCAYLNAVIADYVSDAGWELVEELPVARRLSAATAFREYGEVQLRRMNHKSAPMNPGKSDACGINGIMSYGGIPAELRRARGSVDLSWCALQALPDANNSAYTYMQTHLMGTIPHAELMLRRGDTRMYNNLSGDGSGSMLKAIKFVIANPTDASKSYDWTANKKSPLYLAYSYYRDPDIRARLDGGNRNTNGVSFRGLYVYYTQLTHPVVEGGNVILKMIISPPK